MVDLSSIRFWVQTRRESAGFREHHDIAEQALRGGAQGIVLAEDRFEDEALCETALWVKRTCNGYRAPLIVRNHAAAFITGAHGLLFEKNHPLLSSCPVPDGFDGWLILEDGVHPGLLNLPAPVIRLVRPDRPEPNAGKRIYDCRDTRLDALEAGRFPAKGPVLFCEAAMDRNDVTGACRTIKERMRWE